MRLWVEESAHTFSRAAATAEALSAAAMDLPIPSMQNVVRAAAASARAQSSMDPVKLIASDGTEIIIDRRAALVSGTIKSMLAGPGASRRHASSCGHSLLLRGIFLPVVHVYLLSSPRAHVRARAATVLRAGQFAESQQGEIKFPEISAKVLEKTVQYFYYKLKYTNHQGTLPPFDIEAEHALELLMAANFLDT